MSRKIPPLLPNWGLPAQLLQRLPLQQGQLRHLTILHQPARRTVECFIFWSNEDHSSTRSSAYLKVDHLHLLEDGPKRISDREKAVLWRVEVQPLDLWEDVCRKTSQLTLSSPSWLILLVFRFFAFLLPSSATIPARLDFSANCFAVYCCKIAEQKVACWHQRRWWVCICFQAFRLLQLYYLIICHKQKPDELSRQVAFIMRK